MQFRPLCGRDKQFPPTFPLFILGTFAISAVGFGEIQRAGESRENKCFLSPITFSLLSLALSLSLLCYFPFLPISTPDGF